MKICYICADFGIPILGRKGCSTHVRETSRALQQAGHEIFILTPNPGEDRPGNTDIELIEVPPIRFKWMGSDLRYYCYNRQIQKAAAAIFQQRRPDVIYERYSLYSTAGANLARRFSVPRILEVNSFLVHEQRDRLHFPKIANWIEKRILLSAPYVIVVSVPLRETFLKLGVPADRLAIMPMAVDVQAFHPGVEPIDLHHQHNIPKGITKVGYVGTLTNWHGIDRIYEVAWHLKNKSVPVIILVIGGDKSKVEDHRQRVRDAGLQDIIWFLGSISHQQVPRYINALDITLIPGSHLWASPTKLFEYQAMAKPSIAPRLIPVQEALTHGQEGLLFEPGKSEQIVEHIITLHTQPELRKKMGRQARERVVHSHAWENNTSRIIKIFNQLIEEQKQNGKTE